MYPTVKSLPAVQETQKTWVSCLSREDPLQEGMAIHSSVLAWRIPWTEEPGRLQSTGSPNRTLSIVKDCVLAGLHLLSVTCEGCHRVQYTRRFLGTWPPPKVKWVGLLLLWGPPPPNPTPDHHKVLKSSSSH